MMYGKNIDVDETIKLIPNNSIGVEIGVWKGKSSQKFLKKVKHLHLVDSWSPFPYQGLNEHGSYEDYLSRYEELVGSRNPNDFQFFYDTVYKEVCSKFKDKPVTIHRMSSSNFFNSFTEKVDWVYIDGDHSYNGCFQDLKNSLKIINKGGMILGDDYTNKPGVKQAVQDFANLAGLQFSNFYGSQYQICIPVL